jgi:FAD-dependent oxidoreductase domain-containing protein 1
MLRRTTDIAIIGGGIMGSATAYALTEQGFPGTITIVERDLSFKTTSTGRSCGGIRTQFSTPENILMSRVTRDLIDDLTQPFGTDADVAFRGQGYLILASETGRPILLENAIVQRETGARTRILGRSELAMRYPWLNTDTIAAGAVGAHGEEGWCDPSSLHALFRRAAQARGVRYLNAGVVGLETAAAQVSAINLDDGENLDCGVAINAAGAWAGEVARFAGVYLPVEPRKRYVYVFECRNASPELHRAPLTVQPEGIYFRPEGRLFICGRSPSPEQEPDDRDLDSVDYAFFEEEIWPLLAHRVPAFEAIKVVNGWAGFYDFNPFDQNAIIGPHPELKNFYFINGFSGHGIQQAAAAGRAVAELIVTGTYRTIDLGRFGFERIAANRPIRERNVI